MGGFGRGAARAGQHHNVIPAGFPPRPKGDPGALTSAASVWSAAGSELQALARDLSGAGSAVKGSWIGAGADSFQSANASHVSFLQSRAAAMDKVAGGLNRAAQLIEQKQSQWDAALRKANTPAGPSLGSVVSGALTLGALFVPPLLAEAGAADAAAAGSGAATAGATLDAAAVAAGTAEATGAVSSLSAGMRGVAQTLADAAPAFGRNLVAHAVEGAAGGAGWDLVLHQRVKFSDLASGAVAGVVAGLAPGAAPLRWGIGGATSSAGQQYLQKGTVDPVSAGLQGLGWALTDDAVLSAGTHHVGSFIFEHRPTVVPGFDPPKLP